MSSGSKYFRSMSPAPATASTMRRGDSGGPAIRAYKSSSHVQTGLHVGALFESPLEHLEACTAPNRQELWTSISPKASWIAGLVGGCRSREDAGIAFYECF